MFNYFRRVIPYFSIIFVKVLQNFREYETPVLYRISFVLWKLIDTKLAKP